MSLDILDKSYNDYNEGDEFPELGKNIKDLIIKTNDYIVFLDEELNVEWALREYPDLPKEFGEVINYVVHLEMKSEFLDYNNKRTVKRLLAESISRILDDRNYKMATDILGCAEKLLENRNREYSRQWYWSASIVLFLLSAGYIFVIWLNRLFYIDSFGPTGFHLILGSLLGSIGAIASIASRSDKITLDAMAGAPLHRLEATARSFVGAFGAALTVLLLKSGMILQQYGKSFPVIAAFCLIAGFSERFTPGLIDKFNLIDTKGEKSK
jgi:Predicted ABC-type transport system involved in lysophospholipase L1 biosynthesis, permease component